MATLRVFKHEVTSDDTFETSEVSASWTCVEDGKLWRTEFSPMWQDVKPVFELNTDIKRCTTHGGTMGCYYTFEVVTN